MSWRIGDHGFEMTLHASVPRLIQEHLHNWLSKWLSNCGYGLSQVRSWAIHPGGPRILAAIQKCLDLPTEAIDVSRDILRQHGNMSSPTVIFVLERLRQQSAPRPCVALGFGPGLYAEAALFVE
jgi:predicted naringenin-chalcone synthase